MDVAVLGWRELVSGDVRTADQEGLASLGCGGLAAPAAGGDPAGTTQGQQGRAAPRQAGAQGRKANAPGRQDTL